MRGLAIRRRHERRVRRRALRHLLSQGTFMPVPITPRAVGRRAATRAACSCWMCGNPRRFFGELTVQERRADDRLRHDPDLAAYLPLR